MTINYPVSIEKAINLLVSNGFEAYIVGGCVRDALLQKEPNDWDMTTSALPEEALRVFENYKTIPTGLKHGTITVIIDNTPIEITTMRIDGEYHDCRRPDSVKYTSKIEEDLSRRDFTINAMAYNHTNGLVDPFGGHKDIMSKTICCVGNPDKRFNEDALRILRAIRFSSILGFEIESETARSIESTKELLKNVSSERIRSELIKLLQGKNVEEVLNQFKSIIFFIIPELAPLDGFEQHTKYHIYDIWTHTIKVVANVKNTKELRIAALLHDIGKPQKFTIDDNGTGHFKGHPKVSEEMSREILTRLKFSNDEINTVCSIIATHDLRPDGTKKQIAKWCSKFGTDTVADAFALMKADATAQNPIYYDERTATYSLAQNNLDAVINDNSCLKLNDLNINGNDIIKMGANGKKIGEILNYLLENVIDEKISNDKDSLINMAKKLL